MNIMNWADRHFERYGDYADAVVTPIRAWSNGDIHDRSRRLAAALATAGVLPGDRVALWLPNGGELIVAFSAAVRAGAAAVIVGDSSPVDAFQRVLTHSGARAVITTGARASAIRARSSPLLIAATASAGPGDAYVQTLDDMVAQHEPLVVPVERSADDLAQIIYTSGTTGEPKGVVWTHETVRARYEPFADNRSVALAPRRSLCALPLSAAFGAQYLYLRLMQKMSLYLLERFTPEDALATLASNRIEAAMLVPSICEALLAVQGREKYDLKALRSVLVGGAAVQPALVRRFRDAFGVRVTTVYGLTELGPVSRTSPGASSGSVGKVRDDMRIRIVDAQRRDLPPGHVGDVEIGAGRLAGAYFRAEDEPAVAEDGWFRTGDVGYIDKAGELWIAGRSKDIIIQGGVNLYPQPIVDAISGLPGVRDCAVVGAADPYLGEEVVACIVRDATSALDAEQVLARCRSRLDAKHLPARVLFFESLPKTDLGKVKTAQLRAAVEARKAAKVDTPLWRRLVNTTGEQRSRILRAVVEDCLRGILGGSATFDPQRALGELGLDSLGAVQLASSLSTALGRPLSATLAFNNPTIDAISGSLGNAFFDEAPRDSIPAAAPERRDVASPARDPIALIGVGYRLPGNASSLDQLWEMLLDGLDATREIDRWDLADLYDPEPGRPGFSYTKNAALVSDADGFDAEFFSMNRREATALDPQHRMALEASWHAIEDAGYDPRGFSGQRAAVFLGIGASSYEGSDPIGSIAAMAPGRISHFLNLRGTALAVDTTCSSSLIAIELAVAQLRRMQCDVALAGGVNVICSASSFVGLSQIRALAADGRCKTFDASADGFGRGEGCVIFLLKRLEDARRDGDRVLALIRGVASNHDGRSSSLTAPNGNAQEAVIRDALRDAGVDPQDVDYLEAHGTGTRLGDPIEIEAAMRVFGQRRAPLAIGSIKSNIGHLEAAAGAAGALKAAMVVRTGMIPPNVHLRRLNPELEPYAHGFFLPTDRSRLESRPGRPRIAGVTSMGMSGTNVHVVLEQAPDEPGHPAEASGDTHLLCISARNERALRELVGAYRTKLMSEPTHNVGDICYTAAVGRSHFGHRLAVCGSSCQELAARLSANEQRATRERHGQPGGLAFLISGEALADDGAALRLYAAEPVYGRAVDRCAQRLGRSPEELLRCRDGRPDAASFTVAYALAELWQAWGITPGVVMGRGIGEYAAACVAGILDVDAALCVVADHAGNTAVGAGLETWSRIIGNRGEESSLHSAARDAGSLPRGAVTMISTMSGGVVGRAAADAPPEDVSDAGPFISACRALPTSVRIFVEIGLGTGLLDHVRRQIGGERDAVWLACAPDGRLDRESLLRVLAELYMAGVDPAWREMYRGGARRRVALPIYPFQRKRYWSERQDGRRAVSRLRQARGLRAAPQDVPDDTQVQAKLARIVARTLGCEQAPPETANLIDAGVDSLRAAELLGRIRTVFDVRLAPSDFNCAPTLAALAQRIQAAATKALPVSGAAGPRILTIREGSAETPLICFHPAGGQVTAYMRLRGLVRGSCAILAVQSRAVASNETEFAAVDVMAEAYAELVTSLGYRSARLFGWSMGGVIAHAVAAVLERQGVAVQSVGMVDPPEPGREVDVHENALALTGIVYDHNPSAPPPARLMGVLDGADSRHRSARDWFTECEARGLLPAGALTADEFERAWSLYRAHSRLIVECAPRSIRAPLQLWWALPRANSRWTDSTSGPVRERLIGGSHYTIMRMPWVQPIAEEL